MKFGFDGRKQRTGMDLAVRCFQIVSILPTLYFFVGAGYPALYTQKGFFHALFSFGFSALPRAEALAVSAAYRAALSEMLVCFALLGIALAFGIVMKRLFAVSGPASRTARLVYAALIALDLIFRLLPLRCNLAFGLPAAIAGFAFRASCLALILLDLRAEKGK